MIEGQPEELQQWSREVARDPGSPFFLPLAQRYRRSGRRVAAIQLCLRALARNPSHIEGHALLAQLYLETGDHAGADAEWSMVLRLEPEHYGAHRGLGFLRLEQGEYEVARHHLERAAALNPRDPAVREALALSIERRGRGPGAGENLPDRDPVAPVVGEGAGRIFAPLLTDPACLGILVLDERGVVLAGGVKGEGRGSAELLAARLDGVVAEAERALAAVGASPFRSIGLQTGEAWLELVSKGGGLFLLIATRPSAALGVREELRRKALTLAEGLLPDGSAT